VRRRSEEQARSTKNYLERKWGVEWPNTGFCSYIKFSILRHKHFHAAEGVGDAVLPTEWVAQAGLVVGFFERNGLNRHGAAVQNGVITVRLHPRRCVRAPPGSGPAELPGRGRQSRLRCTRWQGTVLEDLFDHTGDALRRLFSSPGGAVTSMRQTFPDPEIDLHSSCARTDGQYSDDCSLAFLPFQEKAKRLETRYQPKHMSFGALPAWARAACPGPLCHCC
jgi:hypothetical protein